MNYSLFRDLPPGLLELSCHCDVLNMLDLPWTVVISCSLEKSNLFVPKGIIAVFKSASVSMDCNMNLHAVKAKVRWNNGFYLIFWSARIVDQHVFSFDCKLLWAYQFVMRLCMDFVFQCQGSFCQKVVQSAFLERGWLPSPKTNCQLWSVMDMSSITII